MNLHEDGRILYIALVDVSQPDGPGVNEREFMLSVFDSFGPRVHMLTPTPRNPCPDVNPRQTTFCRNPKKWDLFGFLRQQWQLRNQIRHLLAKQPFDLIVIRLGALPFGVYMAARESPVPYVLKTVGDVLGGGFVNGRGLKGVIGRSLRGLHRLIVQNIVQGAAGLDTCTKPLLRQHRIEFGLPPDRLLLCGNATNVTRFRPQDPSDARSALGIAHFDPVLGYVGGLPAKRGGMQMLAITARMLGDYPQLGAVIVGGDRKPLLKRARELNIVDRVAIPGRQPYEEIPTYVNSFDVCFALERPYHFQRFGNSYQKIRQFLACGKRIITCAADDSFLLKEDLARTVDPSDLDCIEKSTRELLEWDDDRKRRHAAKCIAYAREHLSTEAALNRRIDFWNELLHRAGRRARHGQCESTAQPIPVGP